MMGVIDYYRYPSLKRGWGGPFNGQLFRQKIFLELIHKIDFAGIIETGTYRGTTTEYLHNCSELPVYTVELIPRFYGYVKARFSSNSKIATHCGDSRKFLQKLIDRKILLDQPVLFYLDAHWEDDLPLREELELIFSHYSNAVVMIDDFCVPGDPGYGYDDYGEGKALTLEYLKALEEFKLALFFPTRPSLYETGVRRGTIVIAQDKSLKEQLSSFMTLKLHQEVPNSNAA